MAPGQGTSQATGITKRWEHHVNKSFCSLTLQSQPCLQPIFLAVITLPWMALLHPRSAQKGGTGSCRSKTDGGGEAPEEKLFVLSVHPHQGWIYVPRRMRQAGFLWDPAISGEMSMSCLKPHRIPDLTPHECKISICLISLLFLSSRSGRTSFCCPCSQHTSCDTRCYTWDCKTSQKTDPLTPGIALKQNTQEYNSGRTKSCVNLSKCCKALT